MKYILIILLFSSCAALKNAKDLKAYKRVAADPFVDAKESVLLAQKCLSVYPFKSSDSSKIVKVSDDSTAYEATIQGLMAVIDTLVAQMEREDTETGFLDTNDVVGSDTRFPNQKRRDSLRIIRNFIRTYQPAPVIRTVEKETPIIDGPRMALMQSQIVACQANNARLLESEAKAVEKLSNKREREGWLIAGGLFLAAITYGVGRLTRRV